MAETGENRQIPERANANEAARVGVSKKMAGEERSAARASNAAFSDAEKGTQARMKKSKQQRSKR